MIDEGLPETWLVAVVEAAKNFQQGDLIETPPIGYAASLDHPVWDLTHAESAAGGVGVAHLALEEADAFPLGIITSQTCDVAEDRPDPVHPWFQISPVYACDNQHRVLNSDYGYTLPKTFRPDHGKRWVADLRIEYPLEKGVLVGREPIAPFTTEQQRINFGEAVGKRRARAALAESIHAFIGTTLHARRRNTEGRVLKAIELATYGLRLQIAEGTRLDPREVKLHIITVGPADSAIRDWYGDWWSEAEAIARESHVALLQNEYHDCKSVDLTVIERLIELRSPFK